MRAWLVGLGGFALVLLAIAAIGLAVWAHGPDVAAASADVHLKPDALGGFGGAPPVADRQTWTERRAPSLRAAFQREIYGEIPDLGTAHVAERRPLDLAALSFADAEDWRVELGDSGRHFNMLVVRPKNAAGPTPVIVMELFCSVRDAVPGRPQSIPEALTPTFKGCNGSGKGIAAALATLILGRYISGPPFEEVLARGYAVALFYPGDVVADRADLASPVLEQIGGTPRAGALAVWARLYSKAYDVLAADQRFDASKIAIWGHSRHGKAALLAGAFDNRFWAVISHQAGRFGAAPTESDRGEPRAKILQHYGYWFTPGLTVTSLLSVDQHLLIALNAPHPVLFTQGAGDFWSDPPGTWRSIGAANPVYRLFGSAGFVQTSPNTPNFGADLVYAQRAGGHGIRESDWRFFLNFLDAHRDRPAVLSRGAARR